jgi:hypothetical protein
MVGDERLNTDAPASANGIKSHQKTLRRRAIEVFVYLGKDGLDRVAGFVFVKVGARVFKGMPYTGTNDLQSLGMLLTVPLPDPHGITDDFTGGGVLSGVHGFPDHAQHFRGHGDADFLSRLHVSNLSLRSLTESSIKSDPCAGSLYKSTCLIQAGQVAPAIRNADDFNNIDGTVIRIWMRFIEDHVRGLDKHPGGFMDFRMALTQAGLVNEKQGLCRNRWK